MNPAILSMLDKYQCQTAQEYKNALKEIIQEVTLLGLWRAKFFEHAAFYGGTALRILYGLDRFSEDIDFSLLAPEETFDLQPYLRSVAGELEAMGFSADVSKEAKAIDTPIESAFIKAGTRECFLKIDIPEYISERIHQNERLKIKIEVDTDPPGGFETEAKTLLQPIAFSVRSYKQPDLFAGKIHAILARSWQSSRIKGRDYYDFVWYIGRDIPVRIGHLEERLRQTGHWASQTRMTREEVIALLEQKFQQLDVSAAKNDVLPFVRDRQSVEIWSNEFFLSLLKRLRTI